MKTSEIIREIKKGHSVQDIKEKYLRERLQQREGYFRAGSGFSIEKLLASIEALGFELEEKKAGQTAYFPVFTKQLTTWRYKLDEFVVVVSFCVSEARAPSEYYQVYCCLPDGSKLCMSKTDNPFHEQISETMRLWPDVEEELKQLCISIPKLKKQIEIGESTLGTLIKSVLPGRTYCLDKKDHDIILKIKLNHRRYIELKFLPTMNVTKILSISEIIDTVSEVMDSVGNINLTVKNYSKDMNWIRQ